MTKSQKARLLLEFLKERDDQAWGAEFVAELHGLAADEGTKTDLQMSKAVADDLLRMINPNSMNENSAGQAKMRSKNRVRKFEGNEPVENTRSSEIELKHRSSKTTADEEHPAIIARRLVSYPPDERHAYLKALNGTLARQVKFLLWQFESGK